jgi:hypothetical protein
VSNREAPRLEERPRLKQKNVALRKTAVPRDCFVPPNFRRIGVDLFERFSDVRFAC